MEICLLYRDSPTPLYYQLSERIKAQIESGEIKAGDKLPSESEMVEAYGIGRLTVRGALSRLVNAGYLKKIHGKGTYCIASGVIAEKLNIDVILDMTDEYFIPYYIKSVSAVLMENNCNFIISDSHDDSDQICKILEEIPKKRSSGVIVQPDYRSDKVSNRVREAFRNLRKAGIPYIMLDSYFEGIETSYTVLDEYQGGIIAAKYLHKLGHIKMAMIYMEQYKDSRLRQEGFTDTLAALGLEKPLLIPYTEEPGQPLIKELSRSGVTAIFCYNDEVAVECLRHLKNAGIQVPKDYSVIGFDDSILASTVEPSLTSIAHPKQLMGELAARTLLDLINKKTTWPFVKVFEPKLIKRESCSRPKRR
jgi:GntR family transcriptional regulator of arabinose operon